MRPIDDNGVAEGEGDGDGLAATIVASSAAMKKAPYLCIGIMRWAYGVPPHITYGLVTSGSVLV